MNERNVEALAAIASSFAIEEAQELAEHLAAQGVLACDTITDDAAINTIMPKLRQPRRISQHDGTILRAALVAYAKGEPVK